MEYIFMQYYVTWLSHWLRVSWPVVARENCQGLSTLYRLCLGLIGLCHRIMFRSMCSYQGESQNESKDMLNFSLVLSICQNCRCVMQRHIRCCMKLYRICDSTDRNASSGLTSVGLLFYAGCSDTFIIILEVNIYIAFGYG